MSPKSHKHIHYNVALVDKLWNLKRLCEVHLKMHIPLNMVLKDEEYRSELLEKALTANDDELTSLVWEVRQLEDSITSASHTGEQFKPAKKTKKGIRLTRLTAVTCSLLLVLGGYLLRSFLPLDAGEVFVIQAISETRIKPASSLTQTAATANGVLTRATTPLFRVHGSNTVGEKLAPRLVESYLMARGGTNIKTEQGKTPVEKAVSAEINGRVEFVEIHAHGSSTAFADLLSGQAELGMSSRRVKEQERELLLSKQGDLTEPGAEHIIGLDGLAIIVNSSNSLGSLSIPQLVKIFSGEITNWSALGGADRPINLYARDENSGTWDSFKSMVLEPSSASISLTAKRFESSTELSDAVAKDEGAIGFIGLPYVRRAKLLAISSTKSSKAIVPTHFTVSTEDYPLARRLYFYLPQKSTNSEAEEFVRFSATERGQSIVEDIGLVSQNIKTGQPFNNNFYPEEMRQLTNRSQRLSINFRFKDGSDELDTKSISDLQRLVKYMEANSPKRVQLFGFTDDEGASEENRELSLRRAKVVEQQLIARGIYPLVARGMGDEAPLASSKTEEGRRMNRRVEVWIL
ncbi:phosphate ABC transporter substrate-binding/OmpA family protein [Cellvibrio sp. QJXJ]|jgi:phosphate transport system substrate-binding protein|uniref:phosphate ABC transporter substrate-binding/OmpA family protein n=1 Tax=Cellvibrio sp. QJXJ TaxID=2964606 RepID=UPI0021C4B8F5|nr:phosphate ABC transporter substrate-binding/OmpA family protein [Cellvibrio sp. QJXJ]UUA74574.1 phosphate ABC transporter substrate-binding/OmpA family protein [Cellvibrio sp. QJXJ]